MRDQAETVVITGAGGGIGLELAKIYLSQGYRVAALDIRIDELAKLALDKTNGRLRSYEVDVSNEEQMEAVAERIVIELGIPYIWINNAGIVDLQKFESSTTESFKRVMDVNFYGAVIGTRIALKLMRKPERGSVVNVSSLNGIVPAPFMTSYVSSKHAVVGFTRALQEEKRQTRSSINISLVLPGFVKTAIMESNAEFAFPKFLKWLVVDAEPAAMDIVRGIEQGRQEIIPTFRGRLLGELGQNFPRMMRRSTRLLLAQNWKQAIGLESIKR